MGTASPPPSPLAPKKKGKRSAWTKEQVEALKAAVAAFEAKHPDGAGRGKWKAIAANVPGRNDAQCRQRWEDSTKEGRKEGTWSDAEDNALRLAVEDTKHVTWRRWTMVAERIPKRTAKQCEYRYKNHLAPKSGAGVDPHGNAGLGLTADVTRNPMNQQKLWLFATMLPPHSGAESFFMLATMPSPAPPYVDAGTKKSLMTAIQLVQPVITEMQKMCDQMPLNMALPMTHPSYAPPSEALSTETNAARMTVEQLRDGLANSAVARLIAGRSSESDEGVVLPAEGPEFSIEELEEDGSLELILRAVASYNMVNCSRCTPRTPTAISSLCPPKDLPSPGQAAAILFPNAIWPTEPAAIARYHEIHEMPLV